MYFAPPTAAHPRRGRLAALPRPSERASSLRRNKVETQALRTPRAIRWLSCKARLRLSREAALYSAVRGAVNGAVLSSISPSGVRLARRVVENV
jgi:hypothetical protein